MHSGQQPSSAQQARHSAQQSARVQPGWAADATGWTGSERADADGVVNPPASATATARAAASAVPANNRERMIVLQNLGRVGTDDTGLLGRDVAPAARIG
jgi:hypothetical protein